jgi:hypothetical protein
LTGPRVWKVIALAGILGMALGLRLWGIKQGLPYVYNTDENALYVPHAVAMFGGGLNPHYFENPPAFTYTLHALFALGFGGTHDVVSEYRLHPANVYLLARGFVAILGVVTVWLLYLTGARLFDARVGLLAAAVLAVAFLPVFYAHLALNDAPTLLPVTLGLLASAGVRARGKLGDYLLAGLSVGLAAATKYTGGIVLLCVVGASVGRYVATDRSRRQAVGLAIAAVAALAAFVAADPYAVLAFGEFKAGLTHQSALSSEAQGKLGAPHRGGLLYYLWTLTWGLGWVPSVAALGGAVAIWKKDRWLGLMLVPALIVFLAIVGTQGRYFGRWILPLFPICCLLGAYFALAAADRCIRWLPARGRSLAPLVLGIVVVAMCGQGLAHSIHSGIVLSRPFTFELARRWMVRNLPLGSRVVVEPIVPNSWLESPTAPPHSGPRGYLWAKFPSSREVVGRDGTTVPRGGRPISIENYERTLRPALVDYYERAGYCWVLTGSTQSGRAYADPAMVPEALAYYRLLKKQAVVAYTASPYSRGQRPVAFNFDWSFDYYPFSYARPGPEITLYRLDRGGCRTR